MSSILETIQSVDEASFLFFNQTIENDFFDWLMPFVTDLHQHWLGIVLLCFLFGFFFYKFSTKKAFLIILHMIAVAGMTDGICFRVIKANIERQRPYRVMEQAERRTDKHWGDSFPSIHAANTAAVATVAASYFPPAAPYFFGVAAIIGISRIYVGVHYPFDVLGGWLIGIFLGIITIVFVKRLILPNGRKTD